MKTLVRCEDADRTKSAVGLTPPMLRVPVISSKAHRLKASKPCHIVIHWVALTEYSQMSTHVRGFQSFFF